MDKTEIEDGESCCWKDNTSIDPDTALSYIDDKLQNLLGHFQKDFEGGVSTENLGAKYGGYGSFLPTYQWSPLLRSHPKNIKEIQNFSSPEFHSELHVEGAAQYSTSPSDAAQSTRFGTGPHSLLSSHTATVPSADIPVKKGPFLSSARNKKFLVKDEPVLSKQPNSSDQRTLKVRIKINDNLAKEKAAIYNGFGLNTTPSSSTGNSPEDSSEMPSQCPGTLEESLSRILQTMTSFPVPGGSLLSPLIESLLCLEMKEKLSQTSSPMKAYRKLSKGKNERVVEKRENLLTSKRGISKPLGDKMTIHMKRDIDVKLGSVQSETLGQGSGFFSDNNSNPLSRKACYVGDHKGADVASRFCNELEGNVSGKKMEVTRGESLESISDQNGGNFEKGDFQSSSIEKTSESRTRKYCKDDPVNGRGNVKSKTNKTYGLSEAASDVSNCSRDPSGQIVAVSENYEVPRGSEKSSSKVKKKLKRSKNGGNLAIQAEGSLISGLDGVPMEKKNSTRVRNTMLDYDNQIVQGNCKDLRPETTGEQVINQTYNSPEGPSSYRAINFNDGALKEKQGASLANPRDISLHKNIDARLVTDSCLKESTNDDHSSLGVVSVMEPSPAAPIVIEEDWVLCDLCQKWRLLPYGTKPEQLPEKWMCSMLNWLPEMNSCDYSEDDTTQALRRLYQSESQSNLKNHVDGNKGGPVQIPGSVQNIQQAVVKNRSLNDMKQPCSGSSLMSNSHKFLVEKKTHTEIEKQENYGGTKEKKMKSKRAVGHYESQKRSRVGVSSVPIKYFSTDESLTSARVEGESRQPPSLEMKTYKEREVSLKERKLKDWQQSQCYLEASKDNGNHLLESNVYVKKKSSENELRKVKKFNISNNVGRESVLSKDDGILNCKGKAVNQKNPVQSGEEAFDLKKGQQAKKRRTKRSASDDMDIPKRDLGSEHFSRAAPSSSSKVSDSRKSRSHFLDVKGSPVESVSSSPFRASKSDKFLPARRNQLRKDASENGHFLMMDANKKSSGEDNILKDQSVTTGRVKASGVSHSESAEVSVVDFQDGNDGQKFGGESRSKVEYPDKYRSGNLLNNEAEAVESPCPGDLRFPHQQNEDKMNKNLDHNVSLFCEEPKNDSFLLSNGKDGSSGNNSEGIKVAVSIGPGEMLANPKESLRDVAKTGPNNAWFHGDPRDLKCGIKLVRDDRDGKLTKDTPQQSQKQNQGCNDRATERRDITRIESRGGISSHVISDHVVGNDPPAHIPSSIPCSCKGNAFNLVPVDSSCNGNSSKMLKQCKDAPTALRNDASSQARVALKKAQELTCTGDRLKDSGFGSESNDAYFQAVLEYLQAASLLETCNYNGNNHGVMSPNQIYSNTAKICELCAHEYEKRGDMAAAALAYKCAEITYTRIVYCKNSSANKDRLDLQSSLQMVPRGESPPSSASDVDNSNYQRMVDKAAIFKGAGGSYVGNHVIVARNRPKFVHLLDFMEDVNSAMEAADKSLDTFAAAKVNFEEAQNNEGFVSVKRVIDFSFQDVDELIRLVRIATDAISRQGFSGNKN